MWCSANWYTGVQRNAWAVIVWCQQCPALLPLCIGQLIAIMDRPCLHPASIVRLKNTAHQYSPASFWGLLIMLYADVGICCNLPFHCRHSVCLPPHHADIICGWPLMKWFLLNAAFMAASICCSPAVAKFATFSIGLLISHFRDVTSFCSQDFLFSALVLNNSQWRQGQDRKY